MKGTNNQLTFDDHPLRARQYVNEFESKLEVFRSRRKKRYPSKINKNLLGKAFDQGTRNLALIREMDSKDTEIFRHHQNIINKEFGEKITLNELKKFNLSDYKKTTASYMAWKHRQICQLCKDKPLGDKFEYLTFQRIYKRARKFLDQYK